MLAVLFQYEGRRTWLAKPQKSTETTTDPHSVENGVNLIAKNDDERVELNREVRQQVVRGCVREEGVPRGVDGRGKQREEFQERGDAGAENLGRGHRVVHLGVQDREGDGGRQIDVRLDERDDLSA